MDNKTKIIILCSTVLAVGFGAGYFFEYNNNFIKTKELILGIKPVRENNFDYKFIYPLLRYDFGDAKYFLEDKTLENKINDYIEQQYQSQNAQSISVYYSDLLTSRWSGVNYETQYYPGSLMKVLIMMDYYRQKQLNQSILQKSLTYTKDIDNQTFSVQYATPTNLVVGQSYTIQYLIENMVENSDDGAAVLLLANDNPDILKAVYKDLNLPAPGDKPVFTISPRDYTSFLRILYNATYLSDNNSEKALTIMSKSTYKDGISAGLPSNVVVAQKFGESTDTDQQGTMVTGMELHNCGVIYNKDRPYTLCVMTRSKGVVDQKQLALIIKNISTIVYNYVNSNSK